MTESLAASRDYVQAEFLTSDQLAEAADVPVRRIDEFIRAECIPRHSYRVTLTRRIESFFGMAEGEPEVTRYFPRSHVRLVIATEERARSTALAKIAAERHAGFVDDYRSEVARLGADLIAPDALAAHIESEYRSWLDGTYGLCTVSASTQDIARKELSILRIKVLTADGTRTDLDSQELRALDAAVSLLDHVTAAFAPHERDRSSRERWINAIRGRYLAAGQVPAEAVKAEGQRL